MCGSHMFDATVLSNDKNVALTILSHYSSLFVPEHISLPSLSHAPGLSGNIFPQTLALCNLLTASLVNKARTMSCRERKGAAEEWARERARDAT